MTASWTTYLAALKARRSGNPRSRELRPQRRRCKLGVERLEDRTLLAVTPTLSAGLLDIKLDAANDNATVSLVAPSTLRVSDGSTNTDFAAGAVNAVNAHGNGAAHQAVVFNGAVHVSGSLAVSGVASVTL